MFYFSYIYIWKEKFLLNDESDGLDTNGDITIYSENLEICGISSGGNGDLIDQEGTLTITGG